MRYINSKKNLGKLERSIVTRITLWSIKTKGAWEMRKNDDVLNKAGKVTDAITNKIPTFFGHVLHMIKNGMIKKMLTQSLGAQNKPGWLKTQTWVKQQNKRNWVLEAEVSNLRNGEWRQCGEGCHKEATITTKNCHAVYKLFHRQQIRISPTICRHRFNKILLKSREIVYRINNWQKCLQL